MMSEETEIGKHRIGMIYEQSAEEGEDLRRTPLAWCENSPGMEMSEGATSRKCRIEEQSAE